MIQVEEVLSSNAPAWKWIAIAALGIVIILNPISTILIAIVASPFLFAWLLFCGVRNVVARRARMSERLVLRRR